MEAWLAPIVFVAFIAVVSTLVVLVLMQASRARHHAENVEVDAIREHLVQDLRDREEDQIRQKIRLVR